MIYLDHAAATPVDPRVLKVMLPYLSEKFANPSGIYQFGVQSRQAVDAARKRVADVVHCHPDEIYFTGSGTEANNWAMFGGCEALKGQGKHIITTGIEHHSVLHPWEELERRGWEVTYLNVDEFGHVDLEKLKKALKPETVLVSIAYANNEIGTVENIAEIGKLVKDWGTGESAHEGKGTKNARQKAHHGPLFHTDGCQAAGALPINVHELNLDLMTLNSGKIYGPKGVGAPYINQKITILPL